MAVKEGDHKAFDKLANKYRKSLYYMLLKMVRNPDDAEDLTQDALAKAFRGIHKFQPRSSFAAWLFRIATNNCIDFLRKKRIATVSLYTNDDDKVPPKYDVRDGELDPNEVVIRNERRAILEYAIDRLPDRFQSILRLRYFKEYTYKEMAAELELPMGTVKAHIFLAKKMLREQLTKINRKQGENII